MLDLGLTINVGKTVISPQLHENSCAEVAKQLYLNGTNLTPITPGFVRNLKKTYMFNSCMEVLRERYGKSFVPNPATLIEKLFPKEKDSKLVWLLVTNPLTGILMPSDEGCQELSPWTAELSAKAIEIYPRVWIDHFVGQATERLNEQLFTFLSGGSPWKDSTRPIPYALNNVYKSIMSELKELLNRIKERFFKDDLTVFMELASFVPDPKTPFMEKKELIQKNVSSSIEVLYKTCIEEI
jgi:hypothetical protein